ncbi:hypothetical protein PUR28_16350 [Streptomyces sp. BE308]|uniref:hypothetical protein n=1 Tax=Streptomyces sp. BE308 TaxID=3002529 RepID=UPI002E796089|nr:hypothetical protein [Streptomyces sp. BE308]MEE1792320.1 hypothetical protein [Streptomyces sp. BE308]
MEQTVFESIGYSAECQDCGEELECWGVQALVDGSLRWDMESTCSACGFAVAACGGDLPAELRGRLLSERGPARLNVDPAARNAAIMRVLRAELGIGLAEVKSVLSEVLEGAHSGTMPEMEFLARRLRASGIDAVAARP